MVVKNHIWSGIYLEYVETGRECESEFLVGFNLFPNWYDMFPHTEAYFDINSHVSSHVETVAVMSREHG